MKLFGSKCPRLVYRNDVSPTISNFDWAPNSQGGPEDTLFPNPGLMYGSLCGVTAGWRT